MASSIKFFLALFLTLSMALSIVMARPLMKNTKSTTLAARLQLDGSSTTTNCWDSLFELQACTSEVIMFFLNGETYLGPNCCRAIHIIEHHCWPAMLGSLGFTADEGIILVGYCDASQNNPLPLGPSTVLEPIEATDLFP